MKPGWYLLAVALLYGAVVTAIAVRQGSELRELRASASSSVISESTAQPATSRSGLWFPLPGAILPDNDAHLPGSKRLYRQGVNQGFDFYDGDSGVPVPYGAAVIAAAPGTLERVDRGYREPEADDWQRLMDAVVDGADDAELDRLRGRQIWLRTEDGRVLRYGHLSALRQGLREGQKVERGQVLGFVGNSGTDEGVAGTRRGVRLHFEVWEGETFFGQEMGPDQVRIEAASLFTGP